MHGGPQGGRLPVQRGQLLALGLHLHLQAVLEVLQRQGKLPAPCADRREQRSAYGTAIQQGGSLWVSNTILSPHIRKDYNKKKWSTNWKVRRESEMGVGQN